MVFEIFQLSLSGVFGISEKFLSEIKVLCEASVESSRFIHVYLKLQCHNKENFRRNFVSLFVKVEYSNLQF